LVKDQVQDEEWVKAKAEWADPLLRGRAEIVCAQTAEQQFLMLPGNPVIKEVVLSVEQK
jgi:hypothetical protein